MVPRFWIHRDITGPTKSDLVMMFALIYGSSIISNLLGSGKSEGLCTTTSSLSFVKYALYDTLGTVVITVILNSRSKRSWIISICSIPKKPQRKPKPKAAEDSGSNTKEAPLTCKRGTDYRNSWQPSLSTD